MLGSQVRTRKSNGNAFNGCGLFNLHGREKGRWCLAVRLGAVYTRKGAPSSCFRLESAQFHPSILPRPPPSPSFTSPPVHSPHTQREKRPTKSPTFAPCASPERSHIPPHFPSPFVPVIQSLSPSYQPATTRAFAIVWLLCRCYRGVSVRLYKGDSFSEKYQFLRHMNFDSRERVKPLCARGRSPLSLPLPSSLSLSRLPLFSFTLCISLFIPLAGVQIKPSMDFFSTEQST